MNGTVNYYHYSVYKLLLVNLGRPRKRGLGEKKKIDSGKPTRRADTSTSTTPAGPFGKKIDFGKTARQA